MISRFSEESAVFCLLLRNFVRFAEQEGAKQISTKLAVRWARLPSKITQVQKANRLGFVRRFAQYVSTLEPGTEVPTQKLIPYQFRRQDPYHYSEGNVVQLVKEARRIDPGNKIKGPTLGTLFAIRTLLNWYRSDVDVEAHLPELATYLGHVHVRDSYWYLSAVPQLLKLAALRWERAEKGGK